ncbi:MAG: FAD-dependent oxidoreductase [Chloroflexota bacterium]
MRNKARLVIVGAGIVGCSAAYHLTQMGWKDIVVIDQGPLYETGGSTSHAPGIIFQTNGSRMMSKMAQYTTSLLYDLEFDGEQCWFPVGAVEVAATEARMQELWRRYGYNTAYDLESHILSPKEVQEKIPMINPDKLEGGLWIPSDGNARAWKSAGAIARKAIASGGAEFYGNTLVTDLELKNGRIEAVVTDQGRVECEQVLLCTNIWGSVLANKIGIKLPMMACAHHYAITEPLPELDHITEWIEEPCVRHQDRSMYFRQWEQGYCTGSYRHEPRIVDPHAVGKDAYHIWRDDDWAVAIEDTIDLYPSLKGREYVEKINGMFTFSIDGFPMMGETHVPGVWTSIGIWVTHSCGAGKSIAEWMTYGSTEWDLREANVNRFHDYQLSRRYFETRSAQNYREVYDIIHPLMQMEDPRNVRLAPYHPRLVEQGAEFFTSSGWEVGQWYEENSRLLEEYDDQIPHRSGWESRFWSRIQGAEHLAVRDHGGMFNISTFTKIEVKGPGALAFLEYMAANKIDQPIGKVVYTALCDKAGGIRADLTVTRVAEDSFWILTGAATGPSEIAWLREHAPDDGSVMIDDVTSTYTGIGLWGPKVREVLQSITEEDISNELFPYFTAQAITIETIPAYALRLSYAGELGWEIYCRSEYGLRLWDLLWEAGRDSGIVALGGGAFNSLRIEKGYRGWGSDIHTEYNPYEAGLGWAVRLNKGDFLGRDALVKIKEEGITRKLCAMTFDDANGVAMGKEPIMDGDTCIGQVTSADYGYTVGKFIMYGYLPLAYAEEGSKVEIQYFDRRYTATVTKEPLFDPTMERLKA